MEAKGNGKKLNSIFTPAAALEDALARKTLKAIVTESGLKMPKDYFDALTLMATPERLEDLYSRALADGDIKTAWLMYRWMAEMSYGRPRESLAVSHSVDPIRSMTDAQLADIRAEAERAIRERKIISEVVKHESAPVIG